MFYTIQSIAPVCQKLRSIGRHLVLATGFFDLLHEEHINFLIKAKAAGDILIVAVESDTRARIVKGEGRPIEPQEVRCRHILELRAPEVPTEHSSENNLVDYVIALGDDFDNQTAYENLIAAIKPNIYAVSSHTSYLENKQALTAKYGGKLAVVHDFNPSISTTKILHTQNRL